MAIRPRKVSGGYQGRYTGADGRQHSAGVHATQRAAAMAAAEREREVRGGTWVDPDRGKITFAEFAQLALKIRRAKLAPGTILMDESRLRAHLLPKFGATQLRHISPQLIDAWWSEMPDTPARRAVYFTMRAYLRMAVKYDHIDANPCRTEGASRDSSKVREDVPPELAHEVIESASPALRALLSVMLGGALRPGECLGLDRRHIDLDTGVVRVEQQLSRGAGGAYIRATTKTYKSRSVTLPAWAVEEVKAYMKSGPARMPSSPLWLRPDGVRLGRDAVSKYLRRWGLTPHQLRHTSLTEAMTASGDLFAVMARAGHSDVRSARRYQHVSAERDVAIAEAMNQRRSGATG